MDDRDDRTTPGREPHPADDRPAPTSAGKFLWGEGDIVITPAKWGVTYRPEPNREVLVQDLDELVLHLRQNRPDTPLQEALDAFLAGPTAAHMPARLRAELEDAGLI